MNWYINFHHKAFLEINEFPPEMRAKLTKILELISQVGPMHLREPHVKSLKNKLMEVRLTGKQNISRVIYATLDKQRVIILHGFIKKTQKTPANNLAIASQRLREVMDGKRK